MYNILQNGNIIGTCDSIIYIRLGVNKSYVKCSPSQADGFCAKLPKEFTLEDGTTELATVDTVFCFPEHTLTGKEPVGEVELIEEESSEDVSNKSYGDDYIWEQLDIAYQEGVNSI